MKWKHPLTILAVAALAAGAVVSLNRKSESPVVIPLLPVPAAPPVGILKATADQEAVFKRAFWRRPTGDDRIRNAELSEWKEDGTAVSRWQWFIEVEPSAELKKWLQESNSFSLTPKDIAQLPPSATAAPEWFPVSARGFEIRQSADGRMSLLFSRERNVLFATASGHGFTKAVPPPEKPLVHIETTGRLPLTPPPNPNRP